MHGYPTKNVAKNKNDITYFFIVKIQVGRYT